MFVTIFAPGKVHLLEIAGIRDALFEANCKMNSEDGYRVQLVTEKGTVEESASGVRYLPDASIRNATQHCDTLIVVGPYGLPDRPNGETIRWLRNQARHSRRYGSTCTGAFVLAHAGLLSERRATTHWQYTRNLAEEFPDVSVEPDRIFVCDGPVFSSAGVTAAIDPAFSLIEEDHGRELALWVARRLVVFLKRPGGQSQFSDTLTAQAAVTSPIDMIRLHIAENPRGNLSLDALASVAGRSPRHLARLFRSELGMNPIDYVELARVDIARHLLESSSASIKTTAHAAGFGSTTTFRRAFLRRIGVTPVEYRSRFRTAGTGAANDDESAADMS